MKFLLLFWIFTAASFYTVDPEQQLVAPIFPQSTGYKSGFDSTLYLTAGTGEKSTIRLREFNQQGASRVSIGGTILPHEVFEHEGDVGEFTGYRIENGWIRILHAERHLVHGFVAVRDQGRNLTPFVAQVVQPTRTFRLIGEVSPNGETGISIVNPTSHLQSVKVTFHQVDPFDQSQRTGHVQLDSWQKRSRFLSEFVDLSDLERDHRDTLQGVVQIEGENEIAVGAVRYVPKTQWFQTVLVEGKLDGGGAE